VENVESADRQVVHAEGLRISFEKSGSLATHSE
jgi:hypothetical protein